MRDDREQLDFRMAIIAALAQAVPGGMGRTAVMKCLFFLQEARGVPLGYRFGLYTYGPYDAEVLQDLKLAQAEGVLASHVVAYPHGYGYAIEAAPGAAAVSTRASSLLARHEEALQWVSTTFAHRSASDLEMASTILYVDRASVSAEDELNLSNITARVHDIKPHLRSESIEREAKRLKDMGLLRAAL